jgi:hypothetical protein
VLGGGLYLDAGICEFDFVALLACLVACISCIDTFMLACVVSTTRVNSLLGSCRCLRLKFRQCPRLFKDSGFLR